MKCETPVKQKHMGGRCKRSHPISDEVYVWVNLCV